MRIKFVHTIIVFNPDDFLKKIKSEFKNIDLLSSNFKYAKEQITIGFIAHKGTVNKNSYKLTKSHITVWLTEEQEHLNTVSKEIIQINETSTKNISNFHKNPIKTLMHHKGTLDDSKDVFFTPAIVTRSKNVVIDTSREKAI